MGRQRLDDLFARTRSEGRTAFLPFMTAGLPDPHRSPAVFAAMAEAGADGFEVGIPYSDPLMDGPVIQRGSDTALQHGAGFDASFDVLTRVVSDTGLPALAMTYANPVFRRGVDGFCERLAATGADGVIVPDLPVDEAASLRQAANRHGLGLVLFVAPTSDQRRIEAVAAADPVFIYAVAEMGVTGVRQGSSAHAAALVERIRRVTADTPVVFGVGISTPEQAAAAARAGADGIIVGSALVARVLDAEDDAGLRGVSSLVSEISAALRGLESVERSGA